MRASTIWFWGLLAFACVCIGCIFVCRPIIESDLRNRANEALSGSALREAWQATFAGRDATLIGQSQPPGQSKSDEESTAVTIVGKVFGVRSVVGVTYPPSESSQATASFFVAKEGEGARFGGIFPDEATRNRALRSVRESGLGLGKIIDTSAVNPDLDPSSYDPSWMNFALALVRERLRYISEGSVSVARGYITLGGVVTSVAERERIGREVIQILPVSLFLVNKLRVEGATAEGGSSQEQAALDALAQQMSRDGSAALFDPGGSTVKPSASGYLDRLAEYLRRHPQVQIELGVHTEDRGDAEGAARLTKAQAVALQGCLVDRRVAAARIVPKGYGASERVTGDAAPGARRRITLKVQ